MEERFREGTLSDGQNNIPIQMMSLTERDGRITPQWFRLETEEHEIRLYRIEQVVSRDEKRYVGIREKQFICRIKMGDKRKTLEVRYNVETQRWRIFQFL